MRIVFDNNVVISALIIENSISYKAYKKAALQHELYISDQVIDELVTRLKREKFSRYFPSETVRDELILSYLDTCQKISVGHVVDICRDPDDNKFLALALSSKAELIVSGDQDLLVLVSFNGIPIVTPADFYQTM